jgi:hypothetical protein
MGALSTTGLLTAVFSGFNRSKGFGCIRNSFDMSLGPAEVCGRLFDFFFGFIP